MSRIDVSKIDTRGNSFVSDVRRVIDRFEEQEFTAKMVITVICDDPAHADRPPENIRRSVRWVISQDIERGRLVAVKQGRAGDHTPGIYKRKEK